MQQRRSVVKSRGVGVSRAKPSNCFRCLENLVLPSIFDTSLSSFMSWGLQSCPTTVLSERMWHFRESKHALTPPTYFQGVRTPSNPVIYAPAFMPLHRAEKVLLATSTLLQVYISTSTCTWGSSTIVPVPSTTGLE